VLGRKNKEADQAAAAAEQARAAALREGAKGRRTPSRREAEQARRERVKPTMTRREAARKRREDARAARVAQRQALLAGDERGLPIRDRGPVRARVRDLVDARRNMGDFFLPVVLITFVATLVPSVAVKSYGIIALYSAVLLLLIDLFLLSRRLKADLKRRFPDAVAKGDTKGAVMYGVMRATQMRRLRLPKPKVSPGAKV
jgi:hypothetical protein